MHNMLQSAPPAFADSFNSPPIHHRTYDVTTLLTGGLDKPADSAVVPNSCTAIRLCAEPSA